MPCYDAHQQTDDPRVYAPTGYSSKSFNLNCDGSQWCPWAIYQGAAEKCCPYANQMVCCDGTCLSSTCPDEGNSCPSEQLTSLVPSITPLTSSTYTPPASSAQPKTPSPESSSPACACASGWFCASNDSTECCPQNGQAYCSGAEYCYSKAAGETCCGNTICRVGQKCASGGNSCIATTTRSDSTSQPSSSASGATNADHSHSSPIIPSTAATDNQESSALNILQTAVPQTAQSDPAGACFLNTAYATYTTPLWYATMPTKAQSYFASVNAQNTAACVASGDNGGSNSGLSSSVKAGISVGAVLGLAALGGLVYALIKIGILGGTIGASGAGAAGGGAGAGGSSMAQPTSGWNGVSGGEWSGVAGSGGEWSGVAGSGGEWSGMAGSGGEWNGVAGSGAHVPPPASNNIPPIPIIAGDMRRNSQDGTQTYAAPGHSTPSTFTSAPPTSPTERFDNAQYFPPPRGLSPFEAHHDPVHTEMDGRQFQPSTELTGSPGYGERNELSAGNAVLGHEIYSNERFEAPGHGQHY